MFCPVRPGYDAPLVPPPGDHLAHIEAQDEGQGNPAKQDKNLIHKVDHIPETNIIYVQKWMNIIIIRNSFQTNVDIA